MYFLQDKEGLITELRKELRLSNEEHRELLGRVNADDMIRSIRFDYMKKQFINQYFRFLAVFRALLSLMDIFGLCCREWRQAGGHQPGKLSTSQAIHDPIPSPTVSASRKKQKITHLVPPQSFTGPSPSFHQQNVAPPHQPSSSVAKRGAIPTTKGKKQKSVSFRCIDTD